KEIFSKNLPFLGFIEVGRQYLSHTLIKTVVSPKKKPVFPQGFKCKVNQVFFIVAASRVHINVWGIFKGFAHTFPVSSAPNVCKLKHCFWIPGGGVDKIFWSGGAWKLAGVIFHPVTAHTQLAFTMHEDQDLQIA